ncbi:MAG: glycerophosphodiester phosphodiesterase [Brachybacterium sp.]|nr:glycerophosphodiester phosphodiesterase [Brachybacterium sp.]
MMSIAGAHDTGTSTESDAFTIVGHRGAMAHTLENTIASFQQAEQRGCPELELDIRPSADGRLVVVHDATLDRIAADDTGRDLGDVSLMTLEEIQRVPLRGGHRVHTLEEIFAATTVRLQVEIKDPAVVPLLDGVLGDHPEASRRIYLTSFNADALAHARDPVPHIPRGIILHRLPVEEKHPEGLDSLLERTGASSIHSGWEGLTPEMVAAQQAAGRRVHAWPVRSAEDMARAVALGVDGTTVDDPQAAFEWYEQALAAQG